MALKADPIATGSPGLLFPEKSPIPALVFPAFSKYA